jgi:hypothetical protein
MRRIAMKDDLREAIELGRQFYKPRDPVAEQRQFEASRRDHLKRVLLSMVRTAEMHNEHSFTVGLGQSQGCYDEWNFGNGLGGSEQWESSLGRCEGALRQVHEGAKELGIHVTVTRERNGMRVRLSWPSLHRPSGK